MTSLYLDVDGRHAPRREDYLIRMEDLLKEASVDRPSWGRDRRRSAEADLALIRRFVRDEFDRSGVRGLAIFSSAGANLWEDVALPQVVRDRVEVGDRPRLIPLEALLETFEMFCTVVADRERARVFLTAMGRTDEVTGIFDEVPGWHVRGGWSQARFQRHIRDHVQRHLKRVANALLSLEKRRPFDHLILAGSESLVADLERELHDYVARKVLERVAMPTTVGREDVHAHCIEVEARLEAAREEEAVARLALEVGAGTGRAVAGMRDTLGALEAGRVQTLVVAGELRLVGVRCPSCGHLDLEGPRCAACGAGTEPADQLVEEAVESALRQRCRVETVARAPRLAEVGGIGALLRF